METEESMEREFGVDYKLKWETQEERLRAMYAVVGRLTADVDMLKKDNNLYNSYIYDINKQLKKLQYSMGVLEKALIKMGKERWPHQSSKKKR